MRASHILVKHEESRRCASWKDPEGKAIMARSKAQAVETLQGFLARINAAADKGGCCAPAGGGGGGATRARPAHSPHRRSGRVCRHQEAAGRDGARGWGR